MTNRFPGLLAKNFDCLVKSNIETSGLKNPAKGQSCKFYSIAFYKKSYRMVGEKMNNPLSGGVLCKKMHSTPPDIID